MDQNIATDHLTEAPATRGGDRISAIITIWQEILEKPGIAAADEFFEVGGNSMLLLAMLELLQERFGREIQLDDLADGVTPARLATLTA